jgi:hypothetical protein
MVASIHAQGRSFERIGKGNPDELLTWLWSIGRNACPQDFLEFHTTQVDGYEYRVAVTRSAVYLIVRGQQVKIFVTVMKKGTRS